MTLAANSKKNPHGGAINDQYQPYHLDATTYNNKIKALKNAGYVIVRSNVNLIINPMTQTN